VSIGVLLLTALSIAVCAPSVVWAQQNDAASAISMAQSELVQCFDAARAAESAGANISSLTFILNNAGSLLSGAELAYSQGNFTSASSLAAQSQSSLSGFRSDASALKSAAVDSSNLQTLFFVGSIVGTFVVIGGGVAVWVLLKRKYGNEEEVVQNESNPV
jgi:hypothetical protein